MVQRYMTQQVDSMHLSNHSPEAGTRFQQCCLAWYRKRYVSDRGLTLSPTGNGHQANKLSFKTAQQKIVKSILWQLLKGPCLKLVRV